MPGHYSSQSIANLFLDLAARDNKSITNMSLQKLVFFADGWYLGWGDKPLTSDRPQAWRHGPVFPSLYHDFKRFGSQAITSRASFVDFDERGMLCPFEYPRPDDPVVQSLVETAWQTYGDYSPLDLSAMTHMPDTPWSKTWAEANGALNREIPENLTRDYFRPWFSVPAQPAA